MSLLLIEIPPRPRLGARDAGVDAAAGQAMQLPAEWDYVFSQDGKTATRSGRCAVGLLPRADSVVALLAPSELSWHHISLPRTGAARMKAALAGALEEALLEDTEGVHFALPPPGASGDAQWVATTQQAWLGAVLVELESGGLSIDRVLPGAEPVVSPSAAVQGHFALPSQAGEDDLPRLTLAHAGGVSTLALQGSLARTFITRELAREAAQVAATWSATPAAAAAAERWLGAPVRVVSEAQHALSRTASTWNLRQFELVARHRGTRMLREAVRRFLSREWRAVRWGLAGLVAVQLIGLNAHAWQQQRSLTQKREALDSLLRSTHPQVRTVLDAPLQMQRETEALRAAAGRAGDGDMETLLAAAAQAWPEGVAPLQTLRFESGRLTLAAPGLTAAHAGAMQERLRALGLQAQWLEGRVVLSRASGGPG